MSAFDLVILSSSPRDPTDSRKANRPKYGEPSSDDLPSLFEVIHQTKPKKTPLRSGSQAAQIPDDAITGFTSVAKLVKDGVYTLKPKEVDVWEVPSDTENTNTKRKPDRSQKRTKKQNLKVQEANPNGEYHPRPKRVPKRKSDECNDSVLKGVELSLGTELDKTATPLGTIEDHDPLERPDLPPRDANDNKMKPSSRPRKERRRKSSRERSEYFSPAAIQAHSRRTSPENINTADLSRAVSRKSNWTPPKHSELQGDVDRDILSGSVSPRPATDISSFLDRFAYAEADATVLSKSDVGGEALTKRRRIELVQPLNTPVSESPPAPVPVPIPEPKPPQVAPAKKKKGVRTITEIATAHYRLEPEQPPIEQAAMQSICNVLQAGQNPEPKPPSKATKRKKTGKLPKTNATITSKRKKNTEPKKKATKVAKPKLVSPKTVAERLHQQNILFGTASQLAADESPTFTRQIIQAMRESERDAPPVRRTSPPKSRFRRSVSGPSRNLWAAGARENEYDADMSLEEEPVSTKVSGFPSWSESLGLSGPRRGSSEADLKQNTQTSLPKSGEDEWVDIDRLMRDEPQTTSMDSKTDTSLRESLAGAGSSNIGLKSSAITISSDGTTPPRSSISSEGPFAFPSRHSSVRPTYPRPDAHLSQARLLSTSPAKKGRGRLNNTTEATIVNDEDVFLPIEDICDSEEGSTPSPPRRNPPPKKGAELQLVSGSAAGRQTGYLQPADVEAVGEFVLTTTEGTDAAFLKWVDHLRATLFPEITRRVKASTAPERDTEDDPRPFSWHERIMMYEPIIIEDLADWLRDEGLAKAEMPAEAQTGPYGSQRQAAKLKEVKLKAWMVQKWCEERSVCCIWREKQRWNRKQL
ncbi:hypothetical protein P152DRAFT_470319 [Eremomyces bilateralis CBS 781.70]|uniref:Structure-specific endonuclease subunit SLX4 n=1 Tax=Eremomyces bilateralis CBS 781.70 TaxID=1392243 RepID=A0A6G1GE22_9PEZI|nr:uncharacterized protein P152DRAFT_470319 [Eremomyces bilateralis CBS 781.70]KAF1816282.1 hypothetical protein P152DRAFT_470319 [Eremomyces bilateralis CBS 781.70]